MSARNAKAGAAIRKGLTGAIKVVISVKAPEPGKAPARYGEISED